MSAVLAPALSAPHLARHFAALAVTALSLGSSGCGRSESEAKATATRQPPLSAVQPAPQDTKVYTDIADNDDFRRALRDAIGREVAKVAPDWPAAKVDRLTDMVRDYLVAFNTGDFEAYWRFRVPTGRCFLSTESGAAQRLYILRRQAITGTIHISPNRLESVREPKELFALVWKSLGPVARERGVPMYNVSNNSYGSISLEDVRVDLLPITIREFDDANRRIIVSLQHRSLSIYGQQVFLQLLPHYTTAIERDPDGFRWVSVMLPVRLKNGNILPVFVVAHWDGIEDHFLPGFHCSLTGSNPHVIPF